MKLKENEIKIIKLLISSSTYLSSYDIATYTGINRRLIRDEMKNIKKILDSLGFELDSKASKGYIINNLTSESLHFLSQMIEKAERQRESLFPTTPRERSNYITKRLLDKGDYMKIDDLADELLISRSTISGDLKLTRQNIRKYHLQLKQKPNYGICITGSEINKRKPLCDVLFENLTASEMFYDFLNLYINDKSSLEYNIIDILKKYEIGISDIALCDFLLSLSVSTSRIISHRVITEPQDISPIEGRIEFEAAKEIALYLEKYLNCQINELEVNQIAIQLICKRSTKGLKKVGNTPQTQSIINEIFTKIYEETYITFNNQEFYDLFNLYITSSLIRITYNEKIRTPFYDKLKPAYPIAYYLSEITSSIIKKYTHKSLSSSELAFFAMIFNTEIHIQKSKKKDALLICGLGRSSENLCSFYITRRFAGQINIARTAQYYEIPDIDLNQFDLIISTVNIHNNFPIPYINISAIITNEDLNKIQLFLNNILNKNNPETLFHPKLYKDHVKVKTKRAITNELFQLLKDQYPTIKQSFQNTLLAKNQTSFIPFNNKIGILKLQKPINTNDILTVLVFDTPIIYEEKEIQLFILFSCTDASYYIYNSLYNSLKILSEYSDMLNSFFDNPSYSKFLKMITPAHIRK